MPQQVKDPALVLVHPWPKVLKHAVGLAKKKKKNTKFTGKPEEKLLH